jgi:hypothetical protein
MIIILKVIEKEIFEIVRSYPSKLASILKMSDQLTKMGDKTRKIKYIWSGNELLLSKASAPNLSSLLLPAIAKN